MEGPNLASTGAYSKRILLGGAIAMALVIVISLIVSYAGELIPPSLVSTNPKDGQSAVSPFTTVTAKFDRPISQDNKNNFKITPNVGGTVQIVGDTLTFLPGHSLSLGQRYTVTISNPAGDWGRQGNTVNFSFTTRTEQQLDQTDKQNLQGESSLALGKVAQDAQNNDPIIQRGYAIENLIQKLPYETDTYLVEYLQKPNIFYVTVKQNPFNANKQAAIDWLKTQGIQDLSWINIEFGSYKDVNP